MRRRILLLAAAVPLMFAGIVHGCSGEPPVEDMCRWLGDTENCYREFHKDLPMACGALKDPATDATPITALGTFQTRAMLDSCILDQGGVIKFDPPLESAKLSTTSPPGGPIKVTILDGSGAECGTILYSSKFSFSVTVNPPADADAGGSTSGSSGGTAMGILSGTFSATTPAGRDTMDITCPTNGETHHFDRLQVDDSCKLFTEIVPQAILEANPGGIDVNGFLRLTIQYPPGNDTDISKPPGTVAPDKVMYFDCAIPSALKPCEDGVKSIGETDVDCGGNETYPMCPVRCQAGQLCAKDCDCDLSSICQSVMGLRQCVAVMPPPPPRICGGVICKDGKQDSTETDVDCGGGCTGCPDGDKCKIGTDCLHGACTAGICTMPNCMDKAKNGAETDIDCGGPTCPKCADDKGCATATDCMIGSCFNGVCSQCGDGMKNGMEIDVDCGGPKCAKCTGGKTCGSGVDCASGNCTGGVCIGCDDGKQNLAETDIDCGGPVCPKCTDTKVCGQASDCKNNNCFANKCVSCNDGVKDGLETDVDCGGSGCSGCPEGKVCGAGSDCANKVCSMKICNTCANNVKDGQETDVDCGGNCVALQAPQKCAAGKVCTLNGDCTNGACIGGKCN